MYVHMVKADWRTGSTALKQARQRKSWPDGAPIGRGFSAPYLQPQYAAQIGAKQKTVEGRPGGGWLMGIAANDWSKKMTRVMCVPFRSASLSASCHSQQWALTLVITHSCQRPSRATLFASIARATRRCISRSHVPYFRTVLVGSKKPPRRGASTSYFQGIPEPRGPQRCKAVQ